MINPTLNQIIKLEENRNISHANHRIKSVRERLIRENQAWLRLFFTFARIRYEQDYLPIGRIVCVPEGKEDQSQLGALLVKASLERQKFISDVGEKILPPVSISLKNIENYLEEFADNDLAMLVENDEIVAHMAMIGGVIPYIMKNHDARQFREIKQRYLGTDDYGNMRASTALAAGLISDKAISVHQTVYRCHVGKNLFFGEQGLRLMFYLSDRRPEDVVAAGDKLLDPEKKVYAVIEQYADNPAKRMVERIKVAKFGVLDLTELSELNFK